MTTFGDRLRSARNAAGLTQDELAELLEVSKSAVSSWENNRDSPGFDKLMPLRNALSISLDQLVAGHGVGEGGAVRVNSERASYDPRTADLARDEVRLLRRFRAASDRRRKAVIILLESNGDD